MRGEERRGKEEGRDKTRQDGEIEDSVVFDVVMRMMRMMAIDNERKGKRKEWLSIECSRLP